METSRPVRVLVVDDSAFMRQMVAKILREAGFDVFAARDGVDALAQARAHAPDAITLDVQMPNMDGVEFLRNLMQSCPTPVVMLSSETAKGAEVTMQCLMLGAFDCVQKPSGAISLDIEKSAALIVDRVTAAVESKRRGVRLGVFPQPSLLASPVSAYQRGADSGSGDSSKIVAIASSTGGPVALNQVIPRLPGDLAAPVLIVQHLPANMSEMLANRLADSSNLKVRLATPGDLPACGEALLAPGGAHMALTRGGRIEFSNDPPMWGVRPAADVLFQSLAAHRGSDTVAVVLTGMGRDGAMGAKHIRDSGGTCIAQDERTSVVYGMPRACVENGAEPEILPLNRIADAIVRAVDAGTTSRQERSYGRCA